MDSLHHIIYQSTAVMALSGPELERLLNQSRVHNQLAGVSGMLLYDGNRFLQVLEGPEVAVTHIFSRIVPDCRHTDVQVLANGPLAQRQFSAWSMGLVNYGICSKADFEDPLPAMLSVTDAALWMLLHDFQLNASRMQRYMAS
ncbi:BLUF domain-containing protein [Hymenobacter swuensis]|uniref:BLUF domain-containing protein n=1 Tax=Hymenobacter swuensis DY53 TaxID=1227739 RepID=W8EZ37_9BACT|nr:BLUF domain-containing protein [Hymenobacter swuensis]AHJ97012.1 hypothetical protein Hsw_1417 [Hymenobacter swuensis DY53]